MGWPQPSSEKGEFPLSPFSLLCFGLPILPYPSKTWSPHAINRIFSSPYCQGRKWPISPTSRESLPPACMTARFWEGGGYGKFLVVKKFLPPWSPSVTKICGPTYNFKICGPKASHPCFLELAHVWSWHFLVSISVSVSIRKNAKYQYHYQYQ